VKEAPTGIDPLLEPLLPPAGDAAVQSYLSDLVRTHLEPVFERVIRYKLRLDTRGEAGRADGDDLRQEAVLQVLSELRQLRARPALHPVADVKGLAAVIAYRACAQWMRRRFPRRHALKNRLYYLLTHQTGLGLWRNEQKKFVAGFAVWRRRKDTAPARRLEGLLEQPGLAARLRTLADGSRDGDASSSLAAVFDWIGSPVEFDDLVGLLAELLPLGDDPHEASAGNETDLARLAAAIPDPAWQAEKRIFLERLWDEVRRLSLHQRTALLLNLRDAEGRGCIELFQVTGVASLRELAEALERSAEQLAALWNELPLEDARLADLLGVTRQQVINARRGARERLGSRLKGFL
jgi:DNA-directed RNA polymerase specialized sigma24 family protein